MFSIGMMSCENDLCNENVSINTACKHFNEMIVYGLDLDCKTVVSRVSLKCCLAYDLAKLPEIFKALSAGGSADNDEVEEEE
jgi:hypothetical protein